MNDNRTNLAVVGVDVGTLHDPCRRHGNDVMRRLRELRHTGRGPMTHGWGTPTGRIAARW